MLVHGERHAARSVPLVWHVLFLPLHRKSAPALRTLRCEMLCHAPGTIIAWNVAHFSPESVPARRAERSPESCLTWRLKMSIRIGDEAPDFTAETTEGTIRFHEWIGDKWAILFSHPKDFTPVCTTELGYMAKLKPEFEKRNTKVIGLSIDPVTNHSQWAKDIEETQGTAVNYPMIGDADLNVAKLYDMIHPNASGGSPRTANDNATIRAVFLIGPDKKVKATFTYPMSAGRNFDEVLRLLDALQLNAKHTVATPVNWRPGEDVIIPTSVSDEDAKKKYPDGFKTLKPYLRTVAQPK
ncbi:peroxiredoxin [Caballeronia insecticola]|uniref:Peroxiredoxin n=2 Tax=Caballeronia insecticola TaxID=758793 RepID=R4WLH6_9BURK|nr:peroxiredoxin [Caballeronia insecticola]